MPSVLEMTKEFVMAQIRAGNLPPDAMQTCLHETYMQLRVLQGHEEGRSSHPREVGAGAPVLGSWKKSITKHTVTCLECGAVFKHLSSRHVQAHGLALRAYRITYGIPRGQPLAAKVVTTRRKQLVQQHRPWEHDLTYQKAQARTAAANTQTTPRRTRKRVSAAR